MPLVLGRPLRHQAGEISEALAAFTINVTAPYLLFVLAAFLTTKKLISQITPMLCVTYQHLGLFKIQCKMQELARNNFPLWD